MFAFNLTIHIGVEDQIKINKIIFFLIYYFIYKIL